MTTRIVNRIYNEADYIIINDCTIRDCAKHFGISKSTVHIDVTKRLKLLRPNLYVTVRKVLQKNLEERTQRGGEATRQKWQSLTNVDDYEEGDIVTAVDILPEKYDNFGIPEIIPNILGQQGTVTNKNSVAIEVRFPQDIAKLTHSSYSYDRRLFQKKIIRGDKRVYIK